jgi:hypothetical protein
MYLDTMGKISQQSYRQNRGGFIDYESPDYSYGGY